VSWNKPNDVERVQLKFPCPRCKQRPGDWCLKKFGGPAQYLHAARYKEAEKLRALPLQRKTVQS
jgi:hypothetical protein